MRATYPLVTIALSALVLGKPEGVLWLALSVALTVQGRGACAAAGDARRNPATLPVRGNPGR